MSINKKKINRYITDSDTSSVSESDDNIYYASDSDTDSESEYISDSDTDIQKPVKIIAQPKSSRDLFMELHSRQIKNVPTEWKLSISDLKRICKYIKTSIFDDNNCCLWTGYITNMNNTNKGTYVNFYFKNKKVALHRLLYSNFVAPLDSSEYLKFNCDNKGVCCNLNHYEKYKYSKPSTVKETKKKEIRKDINEIKIINDDDLIVNFD